MVGIGRGRRSPRDAEDCGWGLVLAVDGAFGLGTLVQLVILVSLKVLYELIIWGYRSVL